MVCIARGARPAVFLAALLVGLAASSASAQQRLEGEYGLRVMERDGELEVGWLMEGAARGVLEVYRGDERLHRFETDLAQAHSASFERPGEGPIVLRYGALEAEAAAGSTHGSAGHGLHATTLYLDEGDAPPPGVLTGVDSLFVVGDVHGEYDTLLRLLRNAGLVDAHGGWTGGRSHIAFLGDLFDRGADVTRTLWFLYGLEREAAAAGGRVHVVLGNHEIMVFSDDLRYVSPKESLLAFLHDTTYPRLFDIRESVLGRWLASRPGLMKIDRLLLAHGGVSPEYADWGVEELNDSLRTFLAEDFFYYMGAIFDPEDPTAALVLDPELADRVRAEHVVVMDSVSAQRRLDFFLADNSVFWHREYVRSDTLEPALEAVLYRLDADIHVVAHTPVAPIQARMRGRLIAVDLADAASQMLLLVRHDDGSHTSLRYGLEGPPVPVEIMAAPAPEPAPGDTMAPPDTMAVPPPF